MTNHTAIFSVYQQYKIETIAKLAEDSGATVAEVNAITDLSFEQWKAQEELRRMGHRGYTPPQPHPKTSPLTPTAGGKAVLPSGPSRQTPLLTSSAGQSLSPCREQAMQHRPHHKPVGVTRVVAARIERERKAAEQLSSSGGNLGRQLHGASSSGGVRRSKSWGTDRSRYGKTLDADEDETKGSHRHRHRMHNLPRGVTRIAAARIERERKVAEQLDSIVAARIERSIERAKKVVEQRGEPGQSDEWCHSADSPPIQKLQKAVRRVVTARIERERKAAELRGGTA